MVNSAFQGNPDLKLSCMHGMKQLLDAKKLSRTQTWDIRTYMDAVQTPRVLAEMIRSIYIHLPEQAAYNWTIEHLQAIPVGASLEEIWPNFIHQLMLDEAYGLMQLISSAEVRQIAESFLAAQFQLDAFQWTEDCDQAIQELHLQDNLNLTDILMLCCIKAIVQENTYQLVEDLQSLSQQTNRDYISFTSAELIKILHQAPIKVYI